LAALVLACTGRSDDRGTPGQSAESTLVSAPRSAAEGQRTRADSVPARDESWFAEADSVLRLQLKRSLYRSQPGLLPGIRDCAGAEASDNPPFLVAAARMRILGHDSLSRGDAAEYGNFEAQIRWTTFTVEVTSAARMEPAWALELPPDSTVPYDQAYAVTATPGVDTFEIALQDVAPMSPRWAMCDPVRAASSPQSPFWFFAHAADDWVKPVRWMPADASWNRVRSLADSLSSSDHGS
jgi:hypothetical protein